jgi:PAS domain S-box-containing protein
MTILNTSKTNLRPFRKQRDGIRSSIRTKITLWAGLCLVLVSIILIGYSVITLRQATITNSTNEVIAVAEANAAAVRNQLDLPRFAARSLAQSLTAIKDPSIPVSLSREEVNAMLRRILLENPSFVGTYTVWEPNAFDGNDTQYIKAAAHDSSGRFLPYWVRGDDGVIHTEAMTQHVTAADGDWYSEGRTTKQEVTIAPLYRRIQGKEVTTASFIIPIIYNGNFYGIAGVDAPIGFVQQLVNDIDLYDGTANAVLFTETGRLIAVHERPELTSLSADLIYEDFDEIVPLLETSFTRVSPDGKYLQAFSPIRIGEDGTQWVMGLIIPIEKITAPATTAAIWQTAISTALIVLALALLSFVAGQIVRPMQTLTDAARAVSQGEWSVTASVHSNDETEILANAFNTMTSQLRDSFEKLEQRVQERTKALASVTEVGTATSTILETDKLLQEVVDLTKDRFGFYHAHIYLLDATGTSLVLSSGAGAIGQQMVARGHAIPLEREQSLVARAAREKKGVALNDVTAEPNFLPNPLLPDTHSELAVPMIVADTVIGVFDVQSEVVGRFTDADIAVQTTLAAQVASAVQNARQYTETQALLRELGETESFLDSVIENLPTMLFVKNAGDLRFLRWNKAAEELSGFQREDLMGKNDYDFFPKEEADLFTENDRQVLASGQLLDVPEEPLATAHQGMRYLHTRKVPIYGADGIVKYLLGISEDITERKRNEELTRRRAEQQAAINQITRKIQNTTTVESALQVAVRELGRAIGQETSVRLYTRQDEK